MRAVRKARREAGREETNQIYCQLVMSLSGYVHVPYPSVWT